MKNYKIAVAGTGYVGLSIATLLSQHHQVTAVDIIPEKVEMINNRKVFTFQGHREVGESRSSYSIRVGSTSHFQSSSNQSNLFFM